MFYQSLGNGYIGQSMSVNAKISKEYFEVPLSDINKDMLKELGINETVTFIKYLMKELGSTSYHHTGKFYNKTDFYDLNRYFDISNQEIEKYKNDYTLDKKKEKEKKEYYYGKITFTIWEGKYKNYRNPVDYTEFCLVIGNWAYLENGTKKNINGNSIKNIENLGTKKPRMFNNKKLKNLI